MFELSVAFKYLIPRWRQLSVSIITLISTLVIALVVWLIVVFFSVKDGLENSWVDKIIAVTAPVRITPTERYYKSHYYLIDTISVASDYTLKSIDEKVKSEKADPYNPDSDEELPLAWPKPDLDTDGQLKDLAKLAFQKASALQGVDGLKVSDYATTLTNLRIRLLRHGGVHPTQQFLEHATFLGTFDSDTPSMAKALIAPTAADINNLLHMQSVAIDNIQEENPVAINRVEPKQLSERLQAFFSNFTINELLVPSQGWRIPRALLPTEHLFQGIAILKQDKIARVIIPKNVRDAVQVRDELKVQGWNVAHVTLRIQDNKDISVEVAGKDPSPLPSWVALELPQGFTLNATVEMSSLGNVKSVSEVKFSIQSTIQDVPITGTVPLGNLEIAQALMRKDSDAALIAYATSNNKGIEPPQDSYLGYPVIMPRTFKESGALLGDQGFLSYFTPTPSSVQEQRVPIYIAAFYDPGIIPIGGKLLLADRALIAQVQGASGADENHLSNGINVRFNHIADAAKVKAAIQKELNEAGIAPYWHVATYQEYEFTKDIIQQLQSEKNLFSLISLVIIIVACSNIISMLIILVNDKKLEIGILRSMGASSWSIAVIFGTCGMVMGAVGSIAGILGALLTLRYVNELVAMISKIQGHDLFNPMFYGHTLPTDLSLEALMFVIITTACISLLAGIIPAVKASMMKPSAILRSE